MRQPYYYYYYYYTTTTTTAPAGAPSARAFAHHNLQTTPRASNRECRLIRLGPGLLRFGDIHLVTQNVHFATSRSGAFCGRLISKMAQTSV